MTATIIRYIIGIFMALAGAMLIAAGVMSPYGAMIWASGAAIFLIAMLIVPIVSIKMTTISKRVIAMVALFMLFTGAGHFASAAIGESAMKGGTKTTGPGTLSLLKLSAWLGNVDDTFNVGLAYDKGFGVQADKQLARQWYAEAAERGQWQAQLNLGLLLLDGSADSVDQKSGRRWLEKAAEKGSAQARLSLANALLDGKGGSADAARARDLYVDLAKEGYGKAAYNLGNMHHYGEGIPVNFVEAARYYEIAAQAQIHEAELNLGVLYMNAQGVSRDLKRASALFARARKGSGEISRIAEENQAIIAGVRAQ